VLFSFKLKGMLLHRRSLDVSPSNKILLLGAEHLAQDNKFNFQYQDLDLNLWVPCPSHWPLGHHASHCLLLFFSSPYSNCICRTPFMSLPVPTCTSGLQDLDNFAFKVSGQQTSTHPWHCYSSLAGGCPYIRGWTPAFSSLTLTTQHDDDPVRTRASSFDWGCIALGWSGSGSMIQDRLDQVKGTNESTLIGNSLVSLMHHDPSGLVTILFWLHSLGMIRIRINDPRSLESNQRNQWIHSGPFGFFDTPWSKWYKTNPFWFYSLEVNWARMNDLGPWWNTELSTHVL